MTSVALRNLEEYKIKASILLKQLRSGVDGRSRPAAVRFQQVDYFAVMNVDQIMVQKDQVKRKHALTVIALEKGYATWAELKQKMERLHQVAMAQDSQLCPNSHLRNCGAQDKISVQLILKLSNVLISVERRIA
ncbi:MAG: hypothetical protein GY943_33565 [Chloroflexi bacterium]|nr:hypothetical protein [Chloroflexota bacterium]